MCAARRRGRYTERGTRPALVLSDLAPSGVMIVVTGVLQGWTVNKISTRECGRAHLELLQTWPDFAEHFAEDAASDSELRRRVSRRSCS